MLKTHKKGWCSMKPDLWVLDWSGTVSHDGPNCLEAINRVLDQYNHPRIDWEELRSTYRANLLDFYVERGVKESLENLRTIFRDQFKTLPPPTPIPGAVAAVRALAKIAPVAIFSSHPQDLLRNEVVEYGLKEAVTYALGSVDKAVPKTLTDLMLQAKARPERTIYAGDTHVDIELAHLAGTQSVGVAHPECSYQTYDFLDAFRPKPHRIVRHINELV